MVDPAFAIVEEALDDRCDRLGRVGRHRNIGAGSSCLAMLGGDERVAAFLARRPGAAPGDALRPDSAGM